MLSSTDNRCLRMTFSPVTGEDQLYFLACCCFLVLILKVVGLEYCGVGVSLLFAIVTGTISGIQPILRQSLFG